jgi:hypothetical protein
MKREVRVLLQAAPWCYFSLVDSEMMRTGAMASPMGGADHLVLPRGIRALRSAPTHPRTRSMGILRRRQ